MLHRITTIPFKSKFPLKGVRNFFFAQPTSAENDDFVLKNCQTRQNNKNKQKKTATKLL